MNTITKIKKFVNKILNNIIKCVLACNNLKIKNFNNIDINKLVEINCLKNESAIIIDKEI